MGRVVAILGDPNSGKSVFTYLLYKDAVVRDCSVFRQEGDPAAPTGPWYLESLRDDLRRKLKSPWDEKKVRWVKRSLRGLRKAFDVVLVDLGGGRPPAERVTPELKSILGEVDEVILLCPKEKASQCFARWERELREKAPHVKIVLKCVSDLHGEKSIFDPKTGKCVLVGLDRRKAAYPPEHLRKAVREISEYLDICRK